MNLRVPWNATAHDTPINAVCEHGRHMSRSRASQNVATFMYTHTYTLPTHKYGWQFVYTGCNRKNVRDFGRVFLRSNYTDITQNTYIQSWTVTEILAREKSGLLWCLRTVLVSVTSFSPLLELHSYVRANVAPATLATGGAFSSV